METPSTDRQWLESVQATIALSRELLARSRATLAGPAGERPASEQDTLQALVAEDSAPPAPG